MYGSDDDTAAALRELVGGRLKTNTAFPGSMLPTRSQCGFASPPGSAEQLTAGDVRAVAQPGLTSLHNLFVKAVYSALQHTLSIFKLCKK